MITESLDEDELFQHRNFRHNTWTTRDGRRIAISELKDSHLLAAYKQTGNEDLFKEMVVRLFEQRIDNK